MILTKPSLAQGLFKFLDTLQVEYCVVGDISSFPDTITGDIDIIIPQNEIQRVNQILGRFCRQSGAQILQVLQHEQNAFYFVLYVRSEKQENIFLHPDICGDYYRNARLLLKARDILETRQQATDEKGIPRGFSVPAPDYAFIYYLLKKIDKNELNSAHGAYLSQQWHLNPEGARELLSRYWNVETVKMLSVAAEVDNWALVQKNITHLQKTFRRKAPRYGSILIKESLRIINRIVEPTGLFIVFLGADGSGKSTVIDNVSTAVSPAFRRIQQFHFRPDFFSRNRKKNSKKIVSDPHKDKPYGITKSILKLIYYFFDYVLGYFFLIEPSRIRSTLVVCDRYFQDILVDPKRYRYGAPLKIINWCRKLIPQPDIIFLLDAPKEILQQRKQEVSPAESQRQRMAYIELVQHCDIGHIIDASQPLDVVNAKVENIICQYLSDRTEKRLRLN